MHKPTAPTLLLLAASACTTDAPATNVGGGPTCDPLDGLVSSVLAAGSTTGAGTGGSGETSASSSTSSSTAAGSGGDSPSATSSGAGGGPTDCGCPGDIATRSGARLEVLSARSEDGSSLPVGLYDTERECRCTPTLRPDGVWRCVPDAGCPAWDDADLAVVTIEAGQ